MATLQGTAISAGPQYTGPIGPGITGSYPVNGTPVVNSTTGTSNSSGSGNSASPYAAAGASLVSGLISNIFGGSPNLNTPYTQQTQNQASQLGSLGTTTATAGNQELSQAQQFGQTQAGDVAAARQFYQQNPFTNNFITGQISNAAADAARNDEAGSAQATQNLASRGLAGPNGQSSALTGALAQENLAKTSANDVSRNNIVNSAYQWQQNNMHELTNLDAQTQQQLMGFANQLISSGADISQMSTQDLLSMSQQYLQAQQQASQASSGFGAGIGGILTAAASAGAF